MILLISFLFIPVESYSYYLKTIIAENEKEYTNTIIKLQNIILNLSIECSYEYAIQFANTSTSQSTYINDKKPIFQEKINNDVIDIYMSIHKLLGMIFSYYDIYNDIDDFDEIKIYYTINTIRSIKNLAFNIFENCFNMQFCALKILNLEEKQEYKYNMTKKINSEKFNALAKNYSYETYDYLTKYFDSFAQNFLFNYYKMNHVEGWFD